MHIYSHSLTHTRTHKTKDNAAATTTKALDGKAHNQQHPQRRTGAPRGPVNTRSDENS